MNFLGHIFFSDDNHELMYANLFGDFVKGTHLEKYAPIVQIGIHLHRDIDSYIDHHPKVIELMHKLYPELPKVTGIAIDLFFDHLLSQNWQRFHKKEYEIYLNEFYVYQPINYLEFSDEFKKLIEGIKKHQWLNYYPEKIGLQKASEGISSRMSFENKLTNAPQILEKYETEITNCFFDFMKDAVPYFTEKRKQYAI